MVLCYVALYSECLQQLLLDWLLLCFAIQYYGMLVLLSILVTMICYVALYSECLQQLLLGWFTIVFCHTILWHAGITVNPCYYGIMLCFIVL